MTPQVLIIAGAIVAAIGYATELKSRLAIGLVLWGVIMAGVGGALQTREQFRQDNGFDSYCYLLPPFNIAAPYDSLVRELVLLPVGQYPLHDLQIRIVDLRKFNTNPDWRLDRILPLIGRLEPNQTLLLGEPLSMPADSDQASYTIQFNARNGDWVEALRFRRRDGKWMAALQVLRGNDVLVAKGTEILDKDPKTGAPIW